MPISEGKRVTETPAGGQSRGCTNGQGVGCKPAPGKSGLEAGDLLVLHLSLVPLLCDLRQDRDLL